MLFCMRLVRMLPVALMLYAHASYADPLVNGATLSASISPSGDTDTHTFSVNAGDTILLHIGDPDASSLSPWIRLFDPFATQVESSFGPGAGGIEHQAAFAGT